MNVDSVPFRERVRADHVPTVSDLAWSLAGAGADECMAVDHRRRSFPPRRVLNYSTERILAEYVEHHNIA
jgi:hypothetical protein